MQDLLRTPNFIRLWIAQIVSGMGDVLYNVGIMVTIFEQTGSALQTAGVMIANTLPHFLLGPLAGVVVDRYSRKWVMVAMDLSRALLVGGLFLAARGDQLNLWLIYGIVAALAMATSLYQPARLAIIPSLVSPAQLVRANSLIMGTTQATLALGYILGGVLIVWFNLRLLILIDLLSFLLAGLFVAGIRPAARTAGSDAPPSIPFFFAVREGLSYLRHSDLPRTLVTMEILEHVPHGIWTSALMLVFVREALEGTVQDWGYQASSYYTGQLVGALIATLAARALARRPGWAIIVNSALFSLLTLAFALSPTVLFSIVLAFFFGPSFTMRDIAQDSLLQATVPPRVMGRVYALRNMFLNLNFMLAGIGFAWLADRASVRWIYLIGALLYAGTALYALSSRALRESRIHGEPEVVPVV